MAPFSYHLGTLPIAPATVLAPMEGITDRPFRRLIRSLGGCGLTVTEFVSSEGLSRDVERAWRTAALDPDEHPVAIQIYGRDPGAMASAAARCQDAGASVVDINFGCPSKAVTSGSAGSALMRDPERSQAILRAVRRALTVPMTVKMRLGWSPAERNAVTIARIAEGEGADQLVVHGRTREDAYRGHADWHAVREVTEAVSVPVLVNGDILTVEDADDALEASGAVGVMVGRGALRNPWLLRQIAEHRAGTAPVAPTLAERRALLMRYLDLLAGEYPAASLLGRIKKVTGFFTRGLYQSVHAREAVYHSGDEASARAALHAYFDLLEERGGDDVFGSVDDAAVDPRRWDGGSRAFAPRRSST